MKIVSFMMNGAARYGALKDGGLVDLTDALGGRYPDLLTALERDGLAELSNYQRSAKPTLSLDGLDYLPVITRPPKIICVGINYDDHRIEAGKDMPQKPMLFPRYFDSLIAHQKPIIRPKVSDNLDWEAELAVIIGKPGRHISAAKALTHVAGYACFNDASVRDWQFHSTQFTPGKNFHGTGAFGPYMVTSDEVADPQALDIVLRVNGEQRQKSNTSLMLFSIATLIEYISLWTPIRAGDVIATGTPGGVGFKRKPPIFLKPGDQVEVEISGIGTLVNPVIDESTDSAF